MQGVKLLNQKKLMRMFWVQSPLMRKLVFFYLKLFQMKVSIKKQLKKLENLLKHSGENATLTFYLGKAYLALKKEKKADKAFKKTTFLEPGFYQAVIARSLIRETKGKLERGIIYFEILFRRCG